MVCLLELWLTFKKWMIILKYGLIPCSNVIFSCSKNQMIYYFYRLSYNVYSRICIQ